MRHRIQIEVMGTPVPQGSKRAFMAGGRPVVVDVQGEALRTYREAIAYTMKQHIRQPIRGPIELTIDFEFARPRGHYGKRGLLASAPVDKTSKPDIDKCIRSVMDALTGVVYVDDAQVRWVKAAKYWVEATPRTFVLVEWNE
jgi:Holliday junction resolvase RusA-like endonuclease